MYEIASVENEGKHVRTFNDSYGTKYVFRVACTDGTVAETNKQSEEPPKVGDRYTKLLQPKVGAPEGALPSLREKEYEGGNGSGPRSSGGGKARSPEETKAIQRQHSQEMALRWTAVQASRGKVPDDFAYEQLKPIIDWFEKDIGNG